MKIRTLKTVRAFKDWFIIKARNEGSEISVEETHQLLQKEEPVVLLDIREKEEIALGYIKGAYHCPVSPFASELFCYSMTFLSIGSTPTPICFRY